MLWCEYTWFYFSLVYFFLFVVVVDLGRECSERVYTLYAKYEWSERVKRPKQKHVNVIVCEYTNFIRNINQNNVKEKTNEKERRKKIYAKATTVTATTLIRSLCRRANNKWNFKQKKRSGNTNTMQQLCIGDLSISLSRFRYLYDLHFPTVQKSLEQYAYKIQ